MAARSRLAVLLLILASACHHGPPGTSPAPLPQLGEFTLKVVNHGRLDVVIYVVHSGSRERIGEATASATATFKFSMRHLGAGRSYSLFGDPIGSMTENAQTETLIAESGELVIWTLEDDLRRSTVEVREGAADVNSGLAVGSAVGASAMVPGWSLSRAQRGN